MAERLLATGNAERAVEVLRTMVDAASRPRAAAVAAARVLRDGDVLDSAITFAREAVAAEDRPEDALFLAESVRAMRARAESARWESDRNRSEFLAAADQAIRVYEEIARR